MKIVIMMAAFALGGCASGNANRACDPSSLRYVAGAEVSRHGEITCEIQRTIATQVTEFLRGRGQITWLNARYSVSDSGDKWLLILTQDVAFGSSLALYIDPTEFSVEFGGFFQ